MNIKNITSILYSTLALLGVIAASMIILLLTEIGFITTEIEDELAFRELAQPRITWIESETRNCIEYQIFQNDLMSVFADADDSSLLSIPGTTIHDDWVLFALLGESNFPKTISTVHNDQKYKNIKTIIQEHCPSDPAVKSEYQYWFNRTYGTRATYWKKNHVFINY